jgi:hypothetical protein
MGSIILTATDGVIRTLPSIIRTLVAVELCTTTWTFACLSTATTISKSTGIQVRALNKISET